MTAFDTVRKKRTTVMLGASLAVLLAVGGLAYAGVKALRKYEGATKVGSNTIRIPATPVGMLATVDDQNHLTSVTLLVLPPNGVGGGSVVSLPVSTDTTLGLGGDPVPLTEVYSSGGADGLAQAVESVLSVTLDVYQVADPATTVKLLQPLGQITANLPTAAGSEFPAGSHTMTVAQAVQVLDHLTSGEKDRTRRGNVEAVWTGVAARVGAGLNASGAAPTTTAAASTVVASIGDILARLFAGPVGARALPASVLGAKDNPKGKDVEELDRADGIMVMASIAPRSMSAQANGLVFRIEAPPGHEAQVRVAVALIILGGANVQSVYLNGPSQANTVLLMTDERLKDQTACADSGLFGPTVTKKPKTAIEGIDVILQLGTTWLNDPKTLGAAGSGTGSSTCATTATTGG